MENFFGWESKADPGPVEAEFGAVEFGEELLGVGCGYVGEGDGVEAVKDGGCDGVCCFWGGEDGGGEDV